MKLSSLAMLCICLSLAACSGAQTKQLPVDTTTPRMQHSNDDAARYEFSLKTAHPTAAALMQEDFYWSPIEETGPFGNDDGSDAAYGYIRWRQRFPFAGPVAYLKEQAAVWGYPPFDWMELDTSKIRVYIALPTQIDAATMAQMKEALKNSPDTAMRNMSDEKMMEAMNASSKNMGLIYLKGIDDSILGTAFAQFVLEGKIDADMKSFAIIAIKRQLLPMLIERYDAGYQSKRKEQLEKMLAVLHKVKG